MPRLKLVKSSLNRISLSLRIGICVIASLLFNGCITGSMPNLEEPECTQSRDAVKRFYSYHFGNEMPFSPENLKQREKFLTPAFVKELQKLSTLDDVFTTGSDDIPRAFRLGGCRVVDQTKTNVEVLLFWRNDRETRQQSITAEVLKQDDKWLINNILR